MKTVDRLIKGLQILKRYEPNLSPYASHRARRNMEIQEESFAEVSEEDQAKLRELGWEGSGFIWRF